MSISTIHAGVDDTPKGDTIPRSRFVHFCLSLTGTTLNDHTPASDISIGVATAMAMLASCAIAFCGGTILALTELGWGSFSPVLGLAWALLMLAIDRAFIVTFHILAARGRTASLVVRLLNAISAGYIVSEPVVIALYGDAIAQQVTLQNQQKWTEIKPTFAREVAIAKANVVNATKQSALPPGLTSTPEYQAWQTATNTYNYWEQASQLEGAGKGGSLTYGIGPVYAQDISNANAAKTQVDATYAALQAKASSLGIAVSLSPKQLTALKRDRSSAISDYQKAKKRTLTASGLLNQQDALYSIVFSSIPAFMSWLALTVLFVGADTLALLMKALRQETPFERTCREIDALAASEVINEQRRRHIERETMRNAESQSRIEEIEASHDLRRREIDSAVELDRGQENQASRETALGYLRSL